VATTDNAADRGDNVRGGSRQHTFRRRGRPLGGREHERAAPEHASVSVRGEGAEAGPDVPPVSATVKPVAVSMVEPRARHLEVGRRRPRAEDLLAAHELDVVVLGALDWSPPEERR